MTRVAVVGLGWVARQVWLPELDAHPEFELVGGVDLDPRARAEAAERVGGVPFVASLEELLREPPELAVVATPNDLHAPQAAELLERGVSVLVEKPVCLTREEARDLRAAAGRGGGRLFVSRAVPQRADVCALMELVEGGELGRLQAVELEWTRASGIPRPGSWFTNRSRAGGGVLLDLGWHLLDLGFSLLGHPRVGDVLAFGSAEHLAKGVRAARWRGDGAPDEELAIDVEDSVHALMRTEGGVAVELRAAWASFRTRDLTRVAVRGSRGVAELRSTFGFSTDRMPGSSLQVHGAEGTREVALEPAPVGAEYGAFVASLARALAGPPDPHVFDRLDAVVDAVVQIRDAMRAG